MTGWTSDELAKIGAAEELEIASARHDDTLPNPRTIWVVRVGDDLYVRSMYGPGGGWFPGTQVRHQGRIRAGGVDKDVIFADADPDRNDQIDAAYRDNYRRYGERIIGVVVNTEARPATIKLCRADRTRSSTTTTEDGIRPPRLGSQVTAPRGPERRHPPTFNAVCSG